MFTPSFPTRLASDLCLPVDVSCWPKKWRRVASQAAAHSVSATVVVRQRSETVEATGLAYPPFLVGGDVSGAGGEERCRIASAISTPPSTATAAIFAARPISGSLAEAAEAFAAFGLGGGAARGVEHLRAALRRDGGEIGRAHV